MRAEHLGLRVTQAINASGKTRAQIIAESGIDKSSLSKIEKGHAVNLGRDRMTRLAKALGTTVGYLHGDPMVLSPDDREELLRQQRWIYEKLRTIDARSEPNAILIASTSEVADEAEDMIADGGEVSLDIPNAFKRGNVEHVLRAIGQSMIGAGIADNDILYATAAPKKLPLGKLIACRIGDALYVKRLVTEHGHVLLISANPEYLPIEIDNERNDFEVIGVVIGRTGAIV
jgi:SOS-response transcriptional repressor LexA